MIVKEENSTIFQKTFNSMRTQETYLYFCNSTPYIFNYFDCLLNYLQKTMVNYGRKVKNDGDIFI